MTHAEKIKRIASGPVYLRNEIEEAVVRSGEDGWFAKLPGGQEYPVHHSTNMVTEAFMEWIEITREEYERY